MSPEVAALPTANDGEVAPLDPSALLDRAAAFIRSLAGSDRPPTMGRVLALWRLAERELDLSTPGSDAWNAASERFLAARSDYQRLFEVAVLNADSLRRDW